MQQLAITLAPITAYARRYVYREMHTKLINVGFGKTAGDDFASCLGGSSSNHIEIRAIGIACDVLVSIIGDDQNVMFAVAACAGLALRHG